MSPVSKRLPFLQWAKTYDAATLSSDALAAVIVTIMLIPQSLAYAMLAGLPPEIGLYASILPLVAYAVFGSSRTLAVGPVAVVSLMTATAIGQIAAEGTLGYLDAAIMLALLSGVMLVLMGVFRLGFLANFLSHPVISGFITASAILIAAGQMRHILGVAGGGDALPQILQSLWQQLEMTNPITAVIGLGVVGFLVGSRRYLTRILIALHIPKGLAGMLAKAAPILAVATTIILADKLMLGAKGVALVGEIPQGLPSIGLPSFSLGLISTLALPALLISIVGFVESVSVAQTLAAKRRQRIIPDQELIGLGAANIAAGLSSGYPVTGGFARSVVNFDAGAQTPAAGVFTAIGIAFAAIYLTPLLASLPQATLAATIIVAVFSLVDFHAIKRVFAYSKSDFAAMAATIAITLVSGVEYGIVAGVLLSLLLHLYRTSKPHMAVVGQVPGTEHYRNVKRHNVLTRPEILSIRVDESLYFANSRFLEDKIAALIVEQPEIKNVILMCSAVNMIDASALESLEEINRRLSDADIGFHLSEVKGPVMDRLHRTDFLEHLNGKVFLSQHEAMNALA